MRTIREIEAEIRARAIEEGMLLNPDREVLDGIIEGLAINEEKLGYWNCPCRKASGDRVADQDVICPCQYREDDLADFGRCYCALYVTREYIDRGGDPGPIPERRKVISKRNSGFEAGQEMATDKNQGAIKVWRCKVCGYLCARQEAPPVCPICRAKKEKFEEFGF